MHEAAAVGAGPELSGGPAEEAVVAVRERPWIFGLLVAPNSVLANGIIQGGVLAYLMSQRGISGLQASQIISLLALPTTIYFLWSPITDFLMRRRTWLLLGSVLGGAMMTAAFLEKNLASRTAMGLLFVGACVGQLVVSACGGMMGALQSERSKRLAGSFYQAGGLAFGAASVFVLIQASSHGSRKLVAALAGALVAVPGLMALAAPKQDVLAFDSFGETFRRIGTEFKSTFLRWSAIPYTLCMIFPMATGAAVGLLPGVAQSYGVNGSQVAWMNGLAGALLMAAGSLAASVIPPRMRASVTYLSLALLNSGAAAVLWLGPLRPSTYFAGVTLYLFTVGACYALFTAVVLEFLGDSGKSGSGRYSIINSLGNVPVVYMIAVDGWGGNRWGARGFSGIEAVVGGLGAAVLLGYFLTAGRGAKGRAERGFA